MNGAVLSIDMKLQAGRAREVFNAPARRIRGPRHGRAWCAALPKRRFAICADGVRLLDQGHATAVTVVDYQGGHVALTARTLGDLDVLTLIPEAAVLADPKSPGDAVRRGWYDSLTHPLTHNPTGKENE